MNLPYLIGSRSMGVLSGILWSVIAEEQQISKQPLGRRTSSRIDIVTGRTIPCRLTGRERWIKFLGVSFVGNQWSQLDIGIARCQRSFRTFSWCRWEPFTRLRGDFASDQGATTDHNRRDSFLWEPMIPEWILPASGPAIHWEVVTAPIWPRPWR